MERLLSFPEMFMLYANNPAFAGKFYKEDPFNLTLGNARGKIVLLRDFPVGSPVQVSFGLDYGNRVNYGRRPSETPRNPNAPFFMVQDEFSVTTNWDLYDKWIKIKTMINSVHSRINGGDPGGRGRVFLINYLSAAGGSFPYFIASGHSNPATGGPRLATGKSTPAFNSWKDFPRVDCLNKNGPRFIGPVCTIAFEGTNTLTEEHISRNIRRALPGILMADFPGQGLIDEAIALNFGRHRPANPVWQRSQ
jgi:1-phosphatidylinositol phosphodiesterase